MNVLQMKQLPHKLFLLDSIANLLAENKQFLIISCGRNIMYCMWAKLLLSFYFFLNKKRGAHLVTENNFEPNIQSKIDQ